MEVTVEQSEPLREEALRRIEETRVAGRDTRHNRTANLQAIRGLVKGEPHYTFGIKGVDRFSFDEVLDAIAAITKCSKDPSVTTGGGYISPTSTLKGLVEASNRIATVARRGGRFLLGTGHPGSMLVFYGELGDLIREWGGTILDPARGALVPPNLDLEYIRDVAVTTDRCSLMHTHDSRAGDIMLDGVTRVDLVVADHGYAGAAINRGIPVVTVMDTNDPAVAVAKRLGADLTIVPMDDNRPLSCYRPIVDLIRRFGENEASVAAPHPPRSSGASANAVGRRKQTPPRVSLRQDVRDQLVVAEREVARRAGPEASLDELIYSFLESYQDQFLQAHFGSDEAVRSEPDPALSLAIAKRLHDALSQATIEKLSLAESDLTPDEIRSYLGNCEG